MQKTSKRKLTGETRNRVEDLARFGCTEEDIAAELRIRPKRLEKYFKTDHSRGKALGRNGMLEALYKQAVTGTNFSAVAFWVKAQCGWRDTGPVPITNPPNIIVRIDTRSVDQLPDEQVKRFF